MDLILEDVPEENRFKGICLCLYDLPVNTFCLRIKMYAHYTRDSKKDPYKIVLLYDSEKSLYRECICFDRHAGGKLQQEIKEDIINVKGYPDIVVYTHDHSEYENNKYKDIWDKEADQLDPYLDSGGITMHTFYFPGLYHEYFFDLKRLKPFTIESSYHDRTLVFKLD